MARVTTSATVTCILLLYTRDDESHLLQITLDPTNYVTEISGTIGTFQRSEVITSLKIVTLKGAPRSYGRVNGTPFRVPVLDGGKIVGFFGRSGQFLDAIGVYVTP